MFQTTNQNLSVFIELGTVQPTLAKYIASTEPMDTAM